MNNLPPHLRLLVVEDDEISQFLIERLLTDLHITSTIVSNGPDALEILEQEAFDAILMDIEMPVMSGFEATSIIRNSENSAIKNIPIIGMSANPFEIAQEPYLEIGMNEYITKPIHELELLEKLEKQIKTKE
jgi:CheY-like chemotaxis protein